MKGGREEIWKGIRAREQLIRRENQWERARGREREGLEQGGMREESRQIVSLGRENNQRKEGKREMLKGRRSEDGGMSGAWMTDWPQKHQTIVPLSPSKQIKATFS